ncbi:ketopantoate reductase family protein [Caproicibacter fermentans]|nr:ketopantoate reductase family protein [Caproicibacter fermentans]QNK40308.1 ketopantoate reductase family protein [Caproicibacter fermentans]
MEIKKAAMIGLGAIGSVYGKLLHQAYGDDFAVIAGGARARRLKKNGMKVNGQPFFPSVAEPGAEFAADLILVCVKNYQLDQAIEDIRGFVGPGTVLLPLLNGVTAKTRLKRAYPENEVLNGLSIYIDAVRTESGVVNTKDGVIQFGEDDNAVLSPEVALVRDYLNGAGIKTEVCPDMIRAVWKKWMMNVGVNQVSAITRSPYGKIASVPSTLRLFHEAMMEVVALAKASGIDLSEADAREFEAMMGNFSPEGKTSMLQDVEAKRQTEVDYFAGTVVELGKELKVPTPVNHVLFLLLQSIQSLY